MPKIVDHAARRAAIVDTYLDLVAEGGVSAATTRALTSRLRISTGSLWYYFDDLDALVAAARARVLERTDSRLHDRCADLTGLELLFTALLDVLPVDEVTMAEAVVFVNFWSHPSPTADDRASTLPEESGWFAVLRRGLAEAVESGELVPDAPEDEIAALMLSAVLGQQLQCIVDRRPRDGRHVVATCLAPWLTRRGAALRVVRELRTAS